MLIATLAVAAAPRVALYRDLDPALYFELLQVDARHYHEQAVAIVSGNTIARRPFYQDPLYPYFLAGIYRLSGIDPMHVVKVQMALGLVTVAGVALLGASLGGPWVGFVAGVCCALYRPLLFYEILLLKTSLSTTLVTLAFLFATRGRGVAAMLATGLSTGLAILTQGQVWVLVPCLVYAVARRRLSHVVVLVTGMALAIAPVTLRNHQLSGEWILVTSQSGQNLYTGNGPHVRDGRYRAPDFVRPSPRFEEDDFRAEARRRSGRDLKASEVSAWWSRASIDWMRSEPRRAAANFLRKLGEVVNAYEAPDNLSLAFERSRRPHLDQPLLLSYGIVAPLALAFALFALVRRDSVAWMATAAISYHVMVAVFFVFSRYRVPIAPLLIVLAVISISRFAASARAPRRGMAAICLLLLLVATTIVVHLPTDPVGPARARINLANAHAEHAGQLFANGDITGARAHLTIAAEALATAAEDEPTEAEPLFLLSVVQATGGDMNAAASTLGRGLQREPEHIKSLVLLSQVLEKLGRQEESDRRWREAQEIDAEAAADTMRFLRERR